MQERRMKGQLAVVTYVKLRANRAIHHPYTHISAIINKCNLADRLRPSRSSAPVCYNGSFVHAWYIAMP